ncbi:hypothetical protein [Microbaculum marinum]|uniref:Uncharacterized protein n=1 Tax=Microbaculum marinum TaxID=1764581 RepID=A0AAW9RMS4_9HYPH
MSDKGERQSGHPDRRTVVAGLAALLAVPGSAISLSEAAAAGGNWTLATQIITGTQLPDPTVLSLAVEALEHEVGLDVVNRLHAAILKRDAADIVEPFEDSEVEAAARRFVEIVFTGEMTPGNTAGYHTALAWRVLRFTKPPSVCGPDMGWWNKPPAIG